jgi:hypothetical protein
VLGVSKLSGFVARNLSGIKDSERRKLYAKNGIATGDLEDEISGGLRRL